MRVRDGDAIRSPVEQLAVVLAVAARDRLGRGKSEPVGDEREAAALAHVRMRELEKVRQRLRDEEATREARLQLRFERAQLVGIADGDELRRVGGEPRAKIADDVDRNVLELRIALRLGVELGDIEVVVDVGIEMEAGVEHGVHRIAGGRERNRDV